MTCPRCQTINPQGAVACAACGVPLVAMPMQQGYMPPQPGYGQPPYGHPYMVMQPMMPQRSGIPKVMGILMIIFASLGMLGSLAMLAANPLDKIPGGGLVPGFDNLKTVITILSVLGLGVGVLHLIAGIACVGYKRSGPGLALGYAIIRIVAAVIEVALVYAWMKPALEVVPHMKDEIIGQMIGSSLVAIVWPVLVLILLTRPNAKAACVN